MPRPPAPPAGLGAKARAVWTRITKDYELRPDERRLLEDACREVDLIERIEKALSKGDLLVQGSMGQQVTNPLVAEVRQHRTTLARLFNQLHLPDDGDELSPGAASAAARDLANRRHRRGS